MRTFPNNFRIKDRYLENATRWITPVVGNKKVKGQNQSKGRGQAWLIL